MSLKQIILNFNLHLLKEVLYVSSGTYLLGELIKFLISKSCRLNFIILQRNAKVHLSRQESLCALSQENILYQKKATENWFSSLPSINLPSFFCALSK